MQFGLHVIKQIYVEIEENKQKPKEPMQRSMINLMHEYFQLGIFELIHFDRTCLYRSYMYM